MCHTNCEIHEYLTFIINHNLDCLISVAICPITDVRLVSLSLPLLSFPHANTNVFFKTILNQIMMELKQSDPLVYIQWMKYKHKEQED